MTKAELEKLLKAQLAAAKLHLKAVETLEKLANDSVKANDQSDLDKAIAGSRRPRPTGMLTQQQINKAFADAGQGDGALKKVVDELDDINKKTEAIKLRIQNMRMPATPSAAASATPSSIAQAKAKADFEKWLKAQLAAAKLQLKAVETLEKLAKEAVAAGDQGDLDTAIGGSERPSALPTQKEIDDKFAKVGQGDPALKKIVEELRGINKQVEIIKTRIQNMTLPTAAPALDFDALARALKIDKFPNAADKLEKALKQKGEARKKALEALQKETGVTFTPKQMDSLMKAKVP